MNTDRLKKFLAETFFPNSFTCDICGTETFKTNLCPACLKTVKFIGGKRCPVCGRYSPRAEICLECKDKPPAFKRAVSVMSYESGAIILINKFKNGNGYLKEFFADKLAESLEDFPEYDAIVYVPMSRKSLKKRGYNQSKLLAYSLSKRVGAPVIKDALAKVKDTGEQKALGRKEREENLKGCFAVEKKDEIKGRALLLVDDVMTTGSTAEEITGVLLAAGAKCVYFAAAASVEYKIIKTDNASDIKALGNKAGKV